MNPKERTGNLILAGIATLHTVFLIYSPGRKFLLLGTIFYAPGTALDIGARREQKQRVFTPLALGLFLVAVVGAVLGIVFLATGYITLQRKDAPCLTPTAKRRAPTVFTPRSASCGRSSSARRAWPISD